jgi:1-acyl-sn-glycerol-3-phosphate acyltransferase
VESARSAEFEARSRVSLVVQREITRLLAPVSFTLICLALRFARGYRIRDLGETRRRYREIRAGSDAPLFLCANHLTMIDSAVIAWAIGSPFWFFLNFSALPWNVPDRLNFATTPWQRALVYVLKCIPIRRGGNRAEARQTLSDVSQLLRNRETVLIFPEGGRSRSGRVEIDSAAAGVGGVIRSVEGCRVLCVYLRGDHQHTYSHVPVRGEQFTVALSAFEPKTDFRGLRGSRDLARQVVRRLGEMEEEYFDGR